MVGRISNSPSIFIKAYFSLEVGIHLADLLLNSDFDTLVLPGEWKG